MKKKYLLLLTTGNLRIGMLKKLLTEATDRKYLVIATNLREIEEVISGSENYFEYVFIDFPNISGRAAEIITKVNEYLPEAVIFGIHFYVSKKLIDPLFNQGIKGYFLYNPTKQDIKKAFESVKNGEIYLPEQIRD